MSSSPESFEIIPAIDLLGEQCVRLSQGRYDDVTVYDPEPGSVAGRFAAQGICRLHVVDLDGAKAGEPRNRDAIRAIVAAVDGLPVQLGGGIRDLAAVESALELGLERVILGTVALRQPELVSEAARRHPGRIAVGIDARAGRVAVEGWLEDSDLLASELAKRFEGEGVAAIIYTDISRDGMLSGPNFEATAELAQCVSIPVILSGGISNEEDLVRAATYRDVGVAGAIVGKALYTGAVDLSSALEKISCS